MWKTEIRLPTLFHIEPIFFSASRREISLLFSLIIISINGHSCPLPAPRIMKDNSIAARTLTEVAIFFGALTPHVNVTRATNPYPKLLPLSTHSK
uniref:Uncharacterized protein n=1 Tax=mine drainage metagenome TaxID=410659 RepID=E6QQA2_9ZZZZ